MIKNRNLMFKTIPKHIHMWLISLLFVIISFILICIFYKYDKYYTLSGLVIKEGNDSYIQVIVENEKLDIIKDSTLIIDKKLQEYSVSDITPFIYTESGKIYREIKLMFENDYDDREIVNITFKLYTTTIFDEIKNKIKEGMMQ